MAPQLTDIERKILDFMVHYLRDNTYQPSIREIGERFGIKSTKTVSEHLQALATKGFLERDPSRSRGVRILGVDLHPDTVSIPCYSEFPRGHGGFRTDRADTFLTLDRRLAGAKGSFFLMAGADDLAVLGVQEGDYLLIEPVAPEALEDGSVVVVGQDGEPSYHRVELNGQGVVLEALRPGGVRLEVEDPSDVKFVGKLGALYRRMDGMTAPVSLTAH